MQTLPAPQALSAPQTTQNPFYANSTMRELVRTAIQALLAGRFPQVTPIVENFSGSDAPEFRVSYWSGSVVNVKLGPNFNAALHTEALLKDYERVFSRDKRTLETKVRQALASAATSESLMNLSEFVEQVVSVSTEEIAPYVRRIQVTTTAGDFSYRLTLTPEPENAY